MNIELTSINALIGFGLLIWVIVDLFTGKVYLHRAYRRAEEPTGYWLGCTLWLFVALSCFMV